MNKPVTEVTGNILAERARVRGVVVLPEQYHGVVVFTFAWPVVEFRL
jgi:hypothetical protein